jgi:hypothetical protein
MENERNEIKKRKRSRKLRNIFIISLILFGLIGIALNYNILIQWTIPGNTPSIALVHPNNHETINTNTTYFLWNSTDLDNDTLVHVWYADITNTFVSPSARTVSMGHVHPILNNVSVNYTTAPAFEDGKWYWRVEVTDNTTLNVSNTWDFSIKTNALNNFPSLSAPQVTPIVGDTTTNFIYDVIYTDADNNMPSYIRVLIDGVPFAMTELTPLDVNAVDGKSYAYTTTLAAGLHTYLMTCSDGFAINATGLTNNPLVSTFVPPGGPPTPGQKMNKVTINPDNTISYPSERFEGTISITEESSGSLEYEVFWYLSLINSGGNIISSVNGAMAIQTSVVVSYDLKVPLGTAEGDYQLVVKTYDHPIEHVLATQLGMDTKDVTVEKTEKQDPDIQIPGWTIFEDLFNVLSEFPWFWLVILSIAIALPIIAWRKKRGWVLIIGVFVTLLLLLLLEVVSIQFWTFIGLILTLFGGLMFTELGKKAIPGQKLRWFIGGLCIFLGVIMYFGVFVDSLSWLVNK